MNLTWITPHLAIGGRLSSDEGARLARDEGVGAVVDLRRETVDDAAVLGRQGIVFLHLPTDDHAVLSPTVLDSGVTFLDRATEAGRRALVHCEHGIGRSATLVLASLVANGMAPLEALMLAKDKRERVSPSPAQYAGWRDWLEMRRVRRGEGWIVPDFDAFAAIAYRHLGRS